MDDTGSYVASEMPGGLDKEVERLREQALLAWPKEERTLQWLGLRDGMAVLEVGGGPGFVTEQLLARLPHSHLTVVERDPVMIERATQYLHGRGGERVRQVQASVMETGLPDNSVDFAYARLVFQHLPDPVSAAREVFRVLKPGGRLVIADIDDKLHLFDPPAEPEVEAISDRFTQEQEAKGGSRYRGRRLPRILQQAGFHNVDLEAVLVHSDIVGLDKLDSGMDSEVLQAQIEAGLITAEERVLLEASVAHFRASEPLMIITMLMVCGEKP